MNAITLDKKQAILEAALMVAGHTLTVSALQQLFAEEERPSSAEIKSLLTNIKLRHADSGIELIEVASGYRLQSKAELSPWLAKLWEERAPRYSRAFLETLAIIAYKQPITRAEIEAIRGVTISSQIMKTLQERDWVRIVGYRELPGKPAIYGTTKTFLDYFNLKSLADMPSLAEFKTLETQEAALQVQLAMDEEIEADSQEESVDLENNIIAFHENGEHSHSQITTEEASSLDEDEDEAAAF